MSIFEAIIQGIVQGATEFLPISSSGHLALSQHIMGVEIEGLLFDILLHIGTLLAVLAVYYKLIIRLVKEFFLMLGDVFKGKFKWKTMNGDRRLVMMLIIGLLPLFLLFLPVPGTGMNLKDLSESWASSSTVWVVGFSLLATSALLFLGIRADKKTTNDKVVIVNGKEKLVHGRKKIHTIDALCMGFAQCMAAVFPGLSRSGSTLTTGMLRGVNKQTALDYSFILGIPAILAAAVLSVKDAMAAPIDISVGVMIAGVVSSAVVGFLAIKVLKWIVSSNKLSIFAIYTLIVGLLTIAISIIETVNGTNIFTGMPL